MASADQENAADKQVEGPVAFSKRLVKKAPSPRQDELKEKRRKNFLKRVSDGREDKRFEARGEDIMRLDFCQRQKQWEAEQASLAPTLPFEADDDLDEKEDMNELPVSSWTGSAMQISQQLRFSQPEEDVDDVLAMEDEELAALLEYMPNDAVSNGEGGVEGDARSEHLWSDDEDYDALFSELMEQENTMSVARQSAQVPEQDHGEAMDMS